MSGQHGPATRLALRTSVALYRLVVRLRYDRALRRRFGADMEALFRALLSEELEGGVVRGLVRGWARVAHEVMTSSTRSVSPPRIARRGRRSSGIGEDVRQAFRSIRRDPRFTGLVVVVPAVGMALAVAVFAIVNAYLLRPLPYPESDRLVSVSGAAAGNLSWDELEAVFEEAVSWDLDVFSTIGDGQPELLFGAWVTPTFLDVYDVRPALGRRFLPEEGRPGSQPVALISDRLWRDRFGADRAVLGRSFSAYMSDRPEAPESFTIVGVLPADFWYFNRYTDVLVPIVEPRTVYSARLRDDVPIARAREHLTSLARARTPALPDDAVVDVQYTRDLYIADVRPTLLVLQAAVLLVLLIAVGNTAVLLLVRAAARERELGVRRALGAASGRLARQLLAEGLILAVAAGAAGLLLATTSLGALAELIEARIGRSVPGGPGALRIDATVLLATAGLSAVIGLLFGLVPLATSARVPVAAVLGDVGRGGTDSRRRQRVRAAMIAAEVALSLALLTGAGLMVRSAINLQREDLGFTPDRLVAGQIGLRQASYPEVADQVAFFDRLIDDVRALPHVESAALGGSIPFTARFGTAPVAAEQLAAEPRRSEAVTLGAGPGWFETMGIEIVRGRDFVPGDVAGSEPVAVVTEALAHRLWPGGDPIGRRVRTEPRIAGTTGEEPGPWLRVVGVVADVQHQVGGPPPGDLYTSFRQTGRFWLYVIARPRPGVDGASLLTAMGEVLRQLDRDIPLSTPMALDDVVGEARAPTRFLATLLAGFSAFSLLLAVLGLYGVIAYAARHRRRDVAIRMALGADRASVAGLFLRQGMAVVLAGVVLGTLGGYALGRALASQLHGVAPGDPLTHAVLAGLLLVTAGAAVWLPARRAAAAEPMRVLREE